MKLELTLKVKPNKRIEFKQTLDDLNGKLQKICTSLKIMESDDFLLFSVIALWETNIQMQYALKTEEFTILSGAVTALCENIEIKLNDKLVGHQISKLKTL